MARVLPGLRSPRCTVQLQCLAPGVLYSQVSGHATLEAIECLMRGFDLVASEQAPVVAFHDWYQVGSYDSAAREPYVRWAQSHRSKVEAVHLLTSSKVVAMVVSVANLRLGYLESYTLPDAFNARRDAIVGQRSGRR